MCRYLITYYSSRSLYVSPAHAALLAGAHKSDENPISFTDMPMSVMEIIQTLLKTVILVIVTITSAAERVETWTLEKLPFHEQPSTTSFRMFPSPTRPQALEARFEDPGQIPEVERQLYHLPGLLFVLTRVAFIVRSEFRPARRESGDATRPDLSLAAQLLGPLMRLHWSVAVSLALARVWLAGSIHHWAWDYYIWDGRWGY